LKKLRKSGTRRTKTQISILNSTLRSQQSQLLKHLEANLVQTQALTAMELMVVKDKNRPNNLQALGLMKLSLLSKEFNSSYGSSLY